MVRFKQSTRAVTIEEKAVRRGLLERLTWILGHLASGVTICAAVMWATRETSDGPEAPPEPDAIVQTPPEATELDIDAAEVEPAAQLERGDDLLKSGTYAAALRIYGELSAKQTDIGDPSLTFRRALCLELMGEPDRALALYQSIVEHSPAKGAVATGQLGQARCWWRMGKRSPARSLLFSLAVESDSHQDVVGDAFHLLANLAAIEAFDPDPNLMDEKTVMTLNPLTDLGWLGRTVDTWQIKPVPRPHGAPTQTVDRFGADLGEIRLTMRKPATSLGSLIDEIANKAKLQLTHSPTARKILQLRVVSVDVRDIDAATWLDGVLEPVGLVWEQELESVKIQLATEIPRERIRQLRKAQAQRLCRSALTLYPENPLATTTYLTLGNMYFWEENYAEASNSYRELVRRAINGNGLRATWFNLSRASAMAADYEESRQALFKCADLSRGHPIEAVCYLYLGRYFLDDGQPDSAIRQLIRAVSLARDDDVKRQAAEALACAYLMTNNPEAANMTLMDHREVLKEEPHRSKAGFLSALARFRAASHPRDRVRSGRSLANSVAYVDASRFFCFAAYTVVCDAYEDIGLPTQVRAILNEALQKVPRNDVRRQLMFRLGNHHAGEGQFEEAERYMRQLVVEGEAPWARRASLRLAEFAFQRGSGDECLRMCHELLRADLDEAQKASVLKLMGRVYEQKSEHYKAALCFAGLIPATNSKKSISEFFKTVPGESKP